MLNSPETCFRPPASDRKSGTGLLLGMLVSLPGPGVLIPTILKPILRNTGGLRSGETGQQAQPASCSRVDTTTALSIEPFHVLCH